MKMLIERQLYRPMIVFSMIALMQLLTAYDFNLGQVTFIAITKSARQLFRWTFKRGLPHLKHCC